MLNGSRGERDNACDEPSARLRSASRRGSSTIEKFFDFFCDDHHPYGPDRCWSDCTLLIARDKNSMALIGDPPLV